MSSDTCANLATAHFEQEAREAWQRRSTAMKNGRREASHHVSKVDTQGEPRWVETQQYTYRHNHRNRSDGVQEQLRATANVSTANSIAHATA